jgi:hypothetical protein
MIFIISCASTSTQATKENTQEYERFKVYTAVPPDTERLRFREYGNGFLLFDLYETTRYYLQDQNYPEVYCSISYKEYGKYFEEDSQRSIKKIKINDIMVPYSEKNLDPIVNDDVVTIPLEITVGDKIFVFNFNVESVPISIGMSYDEIINILGQPNDETKNIYDTWSLDWPGDPDINNRYRESWVLDYKKYSGRAFFLSPNGVLERFDIH